MSRAVIPVAAALVLAVTSAISADTSAGSTDQPLALSTDQLSVGDLVVVGRPSSNSVCDFSDPVTITTSVPSDGPARWLGLTIDDQCRAVVSAKWNGEMSDGPAQVVDPLMSLTRTESEPVIAQGSTAEPSESVETSEDGGVGTAASFCNRTSEQHVYMYGYAGHWDQLTHLQGRMKFCWDNTKAWVSSHWGGCWGSDPPGGWQWLVDGCWRTKLISGPAWRVQVHHRGDYHCSPPNSWPCDISDPNGYYHYLYSEIWGDGDGTSTCLWTWSGRIAGGVGQNIVQGCH